MNCIIEFNLLEEQNKKHSDKTLYVKVRIKSEESYYDISFLLPTRWKIDESLWIKDKFYEENGIKYIIGGIKGARETGKKQINFKIGPRLNWELKNLLRSLLRDLQRLIDKYKNDLDEKECKLTIEERIRSLKSVDEIIFEETHRSKYWEKN